MEAFQWELRFAISFFTVFSTSFNTWNYASSVERICPWEEINNEFIHRNFLGRKILLNRFGGGAHALDPDQHLSSHVSYEVRPPGQLGFIFPWACACAHGLLCCDVMVLLSQLMIGVSTSLVTPSSSARNLTSGSSLAASIIFVATAGRYSCARSIGKENLA